MGTQSYSGPEDKPGTELWSAVRICNQDLYKVTLWAPVHLFGHRCSLRFFKTSIPASYVHVP